MFVILTYDVGEKRVNKVRKIIKKYLVWTQNSVFEGEITEGKLLKCVSEVSKTMVKKEDSLYIYKVGNPHNILKEIIGQNKSVDDLFI